jgi:hypothetical protein
VYSFDSRAPWGGVIKDDDASALSWSKDIYGGDDFETLPN